MHSSKFNPRIGHSGSRKAVVYRLRIIYLLSIEQVLRLHRPFVRFSTVASITKQCTLPGVVKRVLWPYTGVSGSSWKYVLCRRHTCPHAPVLLPRATVQRLRIGIGPWRRVSKFESGSDLFASTSPLTFPTRLDL
jgi:hypothetical protein